MATNTLLAATLQRRAPGYVNQVSNVIPFFDWLRKKGRYKSQDGGTKLEWVVEYGLDEEEPSYDGFDTLHFPEQDNLMVAEANWKQYYKTIVISGADKRKNSGQQIVNLLEQKETNALESLQQQMSEHFYGDGTGNSSKRITGLSAIVATSPTSGTLFGIDRGTYSWWRNKVKLSGAAAWDISDSNPLMRTDMVNLRNSCGALKTGGKEGRFPDTIFCNQTYYEIYDQMCSKIGQRFVNTDKADAAFGSLMFHGIPLVWDPDCPDYSSTYKALAYFLNSRFLTLNYHPEANFSVTDMAMSDNQDAFTARILWMGELTSSLCAKHGVHGDIRDTTQA